MRNYYGLRCSAKRVTQHKVTFRHENGSASGTYTSSPTAGGASPQGEAKEESCRADRGQTAFAPNTETFSVVHFITVSCRSRLARYPGGLGGRSRIEFIVSPLSRRRHNESHFAAQSPECAFLAKPFFAQAKNGVNLRRRSRKISVESHHPDKRQG